jgi:hypothetical protein
MKKKKKIKELFFLFIMIVIFAGCSNHSARNASANPEDNALNNPEDYALTNPLMGWAPSAIGGPYALPHRLVYYNISWRELEPTKGNFAWASLEETNKLNYWATQGKRAVLRFRMDSPTKDLKHLDIPDWLYNEINGDGTWYHDTNSTIGGFSPNYKNPTLIAEHHRVLTALGARYNKNSMIAFIEIGSMGHWGEFHTCLIDDPNEPGYFPPISIAEGEYAADYIKNFPTKVILMRYPCQTVIDNNLGLYNDMLGDVPNTRNWFLDHITNGYTDKYGPSGALQTHPALPGSWWIHGSGGELGGLQYFANASFNETLQQIKDCHTSWIGPCCPPAFDYYKTGASYETEFSGQGFKSKVNTALRTMGYRFILGNITYPNTVAAGNKVSITMTCENTGVAPFYYPWPLELSLADANGSIVTRTITSEDIRTWLPGTKTISLSFTIPTNIVKGQYTICAAILDPDDAARKPAVDFAMSGKRFDGRYSIGRITIQ